MKEICMKISKFLRIIFGYGIMISLFAGGLTFFGYLAALIIGGDTASTICAVIYKSIIPAIIYTSVIMVLIGLLSMYLAGEKSLTTGSKAKKK